MWMISWSLGKVEFLPMAVYHHWSKVTGDSECAGVDATRASPTHKQHQQSTVPTVIAKRRK
jgi:hypothetical protein